MRCRRCGTLQLDTYPEDIGAYYNSDYYAFGETSSGRTPSGWMMSLAYKHFINNDFRMPYTLQYVLMKKIGSVFKLYGTKVKPESRILDVGGGNGSWLFRLSKWGFRHLTCVDRFCRESESENVRFISVDIKDWDTDEQFDLITMHHSFEHMEEPDKVLQRAAKLLSEDGLLLIRIPVCGCLAWRMYRESWYQIDAPRHFFIYTEMAMRMLLERNGFTLERVVYDSDNRQFLFSEQYRDTELGLDEIVKKRYSVLKQVRFAMKAIAANRRGMGDQAAFYIRKKPFSQGA